MRGELAVIRLIQIIAMLLLMSQSSVPVEQEHYQVIPDEAIRLRILAESDDQADQAIKHAVRDAVNQEISEWVADLTDIEQARTLIQKNLPEIEAIVAQTLEEHDQKLEYQVEYDEQVQFPAKLYDRYVYPAGEYEAILITLGEGKGSNWWCVLFPPLCFLDFSSGTTVTDDNQDEELESEEETPKVSFFFLRWFR
ncbi:stage II sporulation protein R [Amphibacillus sp. MSJ-3]|uniref:stage II sporulation protein R n=1 Tax=Amphibacillus sp. MSJ-3 TaxID=2841505 RepID=UPI001C0E9E9B|nr:stage II sporulation protein R [Amphibacillus sp. MSJ-3]MBU5594853.1 stage II sporulation protein R [Amphibacillus sp. MSJ-3]